MEIKKIRHALFLAGALSLGGALPAHAQSKFVVQSGSPTPTLSQITLYVAKEAGYFADEKLDVELRYTQNAALATQIVASGNADIASVTVEPLIQGYEKGIRGKVFYQKGNRFIYFAAALPTSNIKTLADLQGKKIGVASLGSAAVPVINSSLSAAGVTASAVTYIPVTTGNAALLALKSGQVDALGLWDSAYASYEAAGQSLRYLEDPQISDYGNGAFFASDKTFADKRKELIGFSRAINRASVFILANPGAAVKLYWKSNPGAKTAANESEALEKAAAELKFLSRSYDITGAEKRYGAVDMKKAQKYLNLLKAEGLISQTFDAKALFTAALVDDSNQFDVEKVRTVARGWQ